MIQKQENLKKSDKSRNQYIYEKSLLEQYGYRFITTFEE